MIGDDVRDLPPPLLALFQVFLTEILQFIKWDRALAAAVIKIGVGSTRNEEQFLVFGVLAVLHHVSIGVPAKVAGMGRIAVHHQNRRANLIGVLQDRLIDTSLKSRLKARGRQCKSSGQRKISFCL